MPMAVAGPVTAAPAATEDGVQESKTSAKTTFTVKLLKFDEAKKVAVIKEIKSLIDGLNLVQVFLFILMLRIDFNSLFFLL